jgi:hypothetical protein
MEPRRQSFFESKGPNQSVLWHDSSQVSVANCSRHRSQSIHRLDTQPLLLKGKETRPVRQLVVGGLRAGVAALVQKLKVARVDGEGLVIASADEFTVANVVSPGSTAVSLASEGVGLRASLNSPGAAKRRSSVRAEEAALGTLGLDDHKVLVQSLEGVDLHGLEDVVHGIADNRGSLGEVAGEVAQRHAGAVDLSIVASEEKVHVLAIADKGLVDRASGGFGLGESARVERLSSGPAVCIGRVAGGPVAEGCGTPLVRKNPGALRGEVEERRRNGTLGHSGLRNRAHLRPVAEGAEGHGTVVRSGVMVGRVDKVLTVVGSNGEVLEVDPSVLWLSQHTAGRPTVRRRELTLSCSARCGRQQGDAGRKEFHLDC